MKYIFFIGLDLLLYSVFSFTLYMSIDIYKTPHLLISEYFSVTSFLIL